MSYRQFSKRARILEYLAYLSPLIVGIPMIGVWVVLLIMDTSLGISILPSWVICLSPCIIFSFIVAIAIFATFAILSHYFIFARYIGNQFKRSRRSHDVKYTYFPPAVTVDGHKIISMPVSKRTSGSLIISTEPNDTGLIMQNLQLLYQWKISFKDFDGNMIPVKRKTWIKEMKKLDREGIKLIWVMSSKDKISMRLIYNKDDITQLVKDFDMLQGYFARMRSYR